MALVVNSVAITGPAGPVFDLATTAGLWPSWHPATRAVSGVTERPYRLGELIHEDLEVAGLAARVTWRVTEHDRPRRAVFQSDRPPIRITYTFREAGGVTEFRRELEYDPAALDGKALDPAEVQRLLQTQSEEALRRFKARAEGAFGDEDKRTKETS